MTPQDKLSHKEIVFKLQSVLNLVKDQTLQGSSLLLLWEELMFQNHLSTKTKS